MQILEMHAFAPSTIFREYYIFLGEDVVRPGVPALIKRMDRLLCLISPLLNEAFFMPSNLQSFLRWLHCYSGVIRATELSDTIGSPLKFFHSPPLLFVGTFNLE